jgi:hypothetical protein
MAANLRLIETTWNGIQPCLHEEKCVECECLQGALMEIRLALEDLPATADQDRLLSGVRHAMNGRSPHACLGCDPCNPGNILADFYRAQQASEVATPTACCDT